MSGPSGQIKLTLVSSKSAFRPCSFLVHDCTCCMHACSSYCNSATLCLRTGHFQDCSCAHVRAINADILAFSSRLYFHPQILKGGRHSRFIFSFLGGKLPHCSPFSERGLGTVWPSRGCVSSRIMPETFLPCEFCILHSFP